MDVGRPKVELSMPAGEPLGILILTLASTAVIAGLAVASAWLTI
ncbi:MAG TPA: hypothetical protein VGC50_11470 [Gammaproteobacteria bacterium]|jgi:hypothetical protein